MNRKNCPTVAINIWIAGEPSIIENYPRKHCKDVGDCVTVIKGNYLYTGGQEYGVVVGLRNYPRFPKTAEQLEKNAITLAEELLVAAHQWSCMIECLKKTIWLSRRPASGEGANG